MKTKPGKKVWRWAAGLAAVALTVAAVGVIFWLRGLNQKKLDLTTFLEAHPEAAGIAVYTLDTNGEPLADGYSLFHNADTPLVMASTMKLTVLAAYVEAVAHGALDPNEAVPVSEVEGYLLPLTDGGAHARGLQRLGITVDELGLARDPAATLTLDQIAAIMVHYSGNAETDYLVARLGSEAMAAALAGAGMQHHDPIRPILGATLAIFNREGAAPGSDPAYPTGLQAAWMGSADWRAGQIAALTGGQIQPGLLEQAEWVSRLFPRGTAREYAGLVAAILGGKVVSPETSQQMQALLEGVPGDEPLRMLFFDRWGAKSGVAPGVLTVAAYATPKRGPLAGKTRVAVVLLNELPADLWLSQVQAESYYLLLADLVEGKTGLWAPTP